MKRSKQLAGKFYAVQVDDRGTRRVAEGYSSAHAIAAYLADGCQWIDVTDFAATWIACSVDGGERFEIGMDD